MRIGLSSNARSCEFAMQNLLNQWLIEKKLKFIDEIKISEVSRIPDFLIFKPGNGLINIEAKCNNLAEMMRQLKDNSIYCDYSFAFIPDYCLTPVWFKRVFCQSSYGLIIYNYSNNLITEVFEAHRNKVDRKLQKIVISKIDKELIKRNLKETKTDQKLIEF